MAAEKEITSEDMTVDQAVGVLLSELPKPVQDFVTGPERARITIALSQKYGLHVDTSGVFERAFIFMLLGISTPADFVKSLQEAGIRSDAVQGLTTDINEQVFMKLRAAEQKAPENILPAVIALQPLVQSPAPTPTPVAPAISTAPSFVPPPPQSWTPTAEHDVRTMASDMAMVQSGGQPQAQPTIPPAPVYVPPSAAPVSGPIASVAPIAQVSTASSAPAFVPTPPPVPPQTPVIPKAPTPNSTNREALHDILKQYGVDPYREPAE